MKKILTLALLAVFAMSANAAKPKKAASSNKPVFTTIKENPITSIKDQNRSGTCWDYSTLSYFESEILKATGKTYDSARLSLLTRTIWIAPFRLYASTATVSSLRAVRLTTYCTY